MEGWNLADKNLIRELLLEAVFDPRPQFKNHLLQRCCRFLDYTLANVIRYSKSASIFADTIWICRYSALLAIESDHSLTGYSDQIRQLALSDTDLLVRCKAQSICDTL